MLDGAMNFKQILGLVATGAGVIVAVNTLTSEVHTIEEKGLNLLGAAALVGTGATLLQDVNDFGDEWRGLFG